MNTPLLSLLTLVGVALPAMHPGPPLEFQEGEEQAAQQERDPELLALAAAYFRIADYDDNGWISFREARESLGIDRVRFTVYDSNRDGRITLEEFTEVFFNTIAKLGTYPPPAPDPDNPNAPTLGDLLTEGDPEPVPESREADAPLPTTVLELLGTMIPRGHDERGAPQPGQIVGPVPTFRRLDYDADGGISHADLEILARGSGLDLRLNTLLASLDQNGDGVIDHAEFQGSMRGVPTSDSDR